MNRLRDFVLVTLVVGLAAGVASAQNILVLNEQCGGSAAYFPAALANLGYTFTETNDDASFNAALTGGGPWDLVIVDEYANTLSGGTLTAIQNHIAGGGLAFMNYWTWDAATAAAFEATLGAHYTTPVPILRWDATSPLFTTPNALGDLTPAADTCASDGARFDVTGGGSAVGGYTASPTAGEAAVIIGNGGRTVLFGGIIGLFSGDDDSDGREDGLELAENIVTFLLGPQQPAYQAIPTATGTGLAVLALLVALGGVILLRRLA